MVFEYLDQPLIVDKKFGSQLGPGATTPPCFWHFMKIKIQHQPATLSLQDVAHLDELGTHPAETSALLFLEGWDPDRSQRLLVSIDIEIVKLIEQLGGIAPIGLAFAVEHLGRGHKSLD